MSSRIVLAAVAALALQTPSALAQPNSARLQGTFAITGHVTEAVHVNGEHAGQHVSRTWTFAPLCSTGACRRVSLTRSRAAGTDTLTLKRQRSGRYVGAGRFFAPLNCAGTVHPRGEAVPFKITVRVTATTHTGAGLVATAISATYTNRMRVNRTRCVALPSHDAAVYRGVLTPTAGPATPARTPAARRALTPQSPAGS